jgi:hypothetical protein
MKNMQETLRWLAEEPEELTRKPAIAKTLVDAARAIDHALAALRTARASADDKGDVPSLEEAYRVLDKGIIRALAFLNGEDPDAQAREPMPAANYRRG